MQAVASDRIVRYFVAFTFAWFVIQSAHMVEHVAQVTQKFILGWPKAPGLLGSIFDLEWVHFLYNSSLQVAILTILIFWKRNIKEPLPLVVTAAAVFQGYHTLEHIVKMYQYYALGITVGPKGILGFVVPLIWLHFFFNLITLALIVGMWRSVRPYWGRELSPARA
ncbi:MAG: hypothetical protein ACRDF5_04470 [bacterium]